MEIEILNIGIIRMIFFYARAATKPVFRSLHAGRITEDSFGRLCKSIYEYLTNSFADCFSRNYSGFNPRTPFIEYSTNVTYFSYPFSSTSLDVCF